jgi:hypothetical protein
VYYCTAKKTVEGTLTLTKDAIFFDPDFKNEEKKEKKNKE